MSRTGHLSDRPVARIAASGFVTTGLGSLANLTFLVAAIVRFGASETGVIVVSVACQVVLLRISDMGSMGAIVRYVSMYVAGARAETARPRRVFRMGLVPVAVAGTVAGSILWSIAGDVAELVNPDEVEAMTTSLRAVAVGTPVFALYMNVVHSLKAFEAFGAFRILERLLRPLLYVGMVAATPASVGPARVVVSMQFVHLGLLVVAALTVRRHLAAVSIDGTEGSLSAVAFWRYAVPQGVSGVLDGLLAWSDTILISALVSSSAAASYSAVARVILIYSFAVDASAEVGAPRFSAAVARGDRAAVERTHAELTRFQVGLVWPVAAVLVVWLPDLVTEIDGSLGAAADAARFILVGAFIAAALGPSPILLLMSGRSRALLVGALLSVTLNLGLNISLLPTIGVTGAGIAWSGALVLGVGWAHVLTRAQHRARIADVWTPRARQAIGLGAVAAGAHLVTPDGARVVVGIAFVLVAGAAALRSLLIDRRS